jgi:NADH:ubiquinone oxidoreductase subunit F (NADH-binding)/(2Fe-2S) ferredoxin/NAD-dependent dihydropyrimidine dehydrogenase PreA subunit
MVDHKNGKEAAMSEARLQVMVCSGTGCVSNAAARVRQLLGEALTARGLAGAVEVLPSECNGLCGQGPVLAVQPDGIIYVKVRPEYIPLLVEEHFINNRPVERLMRPVPAPDGRVPLLKDVPFFKNQRLIVMRNRGLINPERIEEYIARDGYFALSKALREMTPEGVIDEMKRSGLRGRGGGGFPTGVKWEEVRKYNRFPKYTICNGDEGDPGAFMDRTVLESDPHSVLEGMAISAYAIGAHQGYIYVRAEYPLAIQSLESAMAQAREYGLLGSDILGCGFDFDVSIYPGAGAFVCGESTALMYSLEGRRGMPRIKPPRSAEAGLWGMPTNLNNVETFANVPAIILNGAAWFASIGTAGSKGTKVFALTGAVSNVGLVEVPMGTTLRTLVFDIGGGIPGGRRFKAAQMGGPSGGCIPEGLLDTPIDFDSLTQAGSMMGSGGVVIMDERTCMVDTAKFFTEFSVDESCGKCVPCREGLKVMLDKLTAITGGTGEPGDVAFLERLARHIQATSHCGLGQTAPNPVLSTIRYFRNEYEAHIREKRCPALMCPALIRFRVKEELCRMCGLCFKACPAHAIRWEKKQPAFIDRSVCTTCRSCIRVCKFGAIE